MSNLISQYIETAERFSIALQLEGMAENSLVRATSNIRPVDTWMDARCVRLNSDSERIWDEHDSKWNELADQKQKRLSIGNELVAITNDAAGLVSDCGGDPAIVLRCTNAAQRYIDRFQSEWFAVRPKLEALLLEAAKPTESYSHPILALSDSLRARDSRLWKRPAIAREYIRRLRISDKKKLDEELARYNNAEKDLMTSYVDILRYRKKQLLYP